MGAAELNAYISPASCHPCLKVNFKGFPRTFISVGGAEYLCPGTKLLAERMIRDLGRGDGVVEEDGKVLLYEAKDAIHDYLIFPWHEPERSETLKEVARWISAAK